MMGARAYPGIFSLTAIGGGIGLAHLLRLPAPVFLSLAAVALAAAATALFLRRGAIASIALVVVLTGFSGFMFARDVYDFDRPHISAVAGADARFHVFGTVDDWPEPRSDRTDVALRVDSLGVGRLEPVSGRMLLKVRDTGSFVQYGDRIEFFARLYPVTGGGGAFDWAGHLRLNGIHALAYAAMSQDIRRAPRPKVGVLPLIDTLRAHLVAALRRNLDPEAAALAGGFLIGETRDIPRAVYRNFRDSGTLHLLAVSGSNVALVIGFVLVLLRPFRAGRPARTICLVAALALFLLVCKGEPSVVRASVMAALVLAARLVGRKIDLNNIIALAAAAILLVDPTQLFSVGFQLSFVTAWGLVFFTPRLYRLLDQKRFGPVRRWLLLVVAVSLVAQVCSAPLIALYFHRVPLLSTFANLLVVPLVSAAVVAVMVLLVLEFLAPPLAAIAGMGVNHVMNAILHLLDFFSGPDAPVLRLDEVSWPAVAMVYGLLVLAAIGISAIRVRRYAVFATLILANLFLARLVAASVDRPPHRVHLAGVPGGIAAVVVGHNARRGDLIVTGLTARDYPLDERVLAPWLEKLSIVELRKVILLRADYDAAEALVRLASDFRAESLYVHRVLAATVSEIAEAPGNAAPPWRDFGGAAIAAGEGLFAGEHGVVLRTGPVELLFARSIGQVEYLGPVAAADSVVRWGIIGGTVDVPDDLTAVGGLDGCLCAEIEQAPSSGAGEVTGDRGELLDLRQTGSVSIELRPDGRQPFLRIFSPN